MPPKKRKCKDEEQQAEKKPKVIYSTQRVTYFRWLRSGVLAPFADAKALAAVGVQATMMTPAYLGMWNRLRDWSLKRAEAYFADHNLVKVRLYLLQ